MDIGKLLKTHREQLQLTQQQVADRLFVSRNTYTQYETGKRKVDAETFVKLVQLLQIPFFEQNKENLQELAKQNEYWNEKRREFFDAIQQDDVQTVKRFIENRMDTEVMYNGTRAFLHAVKQESLQVSTYLLENGVTYYNEEADGELPPLILAIDRGDIHMVNMFIQKGISVHKNYSFHFEPLAVATLLMNQEIFNLLLEHGADINVKTAVNNGVMGIQNETRLCGIIELYYLSHIKLWVSEGKRVSDLFLDAKWKEFIHFLQQHHFEKFDQDNKAYLGYALEMIASAEQDS